MDNAFSSNRSLILHAPNINSGGGLFLLLQFLNIPHISISWAQLDERAKANIPLSLDVSRNYVKRTIFSRLFAEYRLWRKASKTDRILCFHGLPPLFSAKAQAIVLIQNRLVWDKKAQLDVSFVGKVQLSIQRLWLRFAHREHTRYIVPTPAMAALVQQYLGAKARVQIFPFIPLLSPANAHSEHHAPKETFDFIYVASGETHKNHETLLDAWFLLAKAGLNPSLALTIDLQKYPELYDKIEMYQQSHGLNIKNLGHLCSDEVVQLYQSARAMVFPSKVEAFGLPLIDASTHGLPIIASELDYVRDVIVPVETFDPCSPTSLARAIKRFLGQPEPLQKMYSPEAFFTTIINDGQPDR